MGLDGRGPSWSLTVLSGDGGAESRPGEGEETGARVKSQESIQGLRILR